MACSLSSWLVRASRADLAATLTIHGDPEARFRLLQSRDYELDEVGLCGCCALHRCSTAVRWKGALCCLTFELRRPVRWAALGPRRIMEPATGLRGPRVARLAGSPLERGVRPQSCRSVPRWSDLGPEPWFRSEDTGPARAVPRRCFRRLPAGREAPSAGRCRPPAHLTATETSLRRAAAPALMVTAPLETPN
jgi:hypothetical protein